MVADVIDAARHKGTTAKFLWDKSKLQVADIKHCKNRFFVRMEGSREEVLAKGAAYFGAVEPVASVVAGEAAFVTGEMEVAAFEEAAKKAGGIIGRIRVK